MLAALEEAEEDPGVDVENLSGLNDSERGVRFVVSRCGRTVLCREQTSNEFSHHSECSYSLLATFSRANALRHSFMSAHVCV